MGGRFSRLRRGAQSDPYAEEFNEPFYNPRQPGGYSMPPPGPYMPSQGRYGIPAQGRYGIPAQGRYGMPSQGRYGRPSPYAPGGYGSGGGNGSGGGYDDYDPYYDDYGYGYEPTQTIGQFPGGSMGTYGGRYGGGMNPMSGMSPWNYGNYYMGNTTMQMMPYMMKKVAKYAKRQAMSSFGGGGGCIPMMPVMPCLPAACSMPMVAPMMAAATPLPIAFNPLVQGMYPMASMSAGNWMTPSSFMSALSTGPMAYRPPASFQFPSNVNMIMPMAYGTPNPLLSLPSFGGFSPQLNMGSGFSCCCNYCTPAIAAPALPAISYYPNPVSVPQPYPVPFPVPVPIPNIQQIPVPRSVSFVAPPIMAGDCQAFPMPSGAPLMSSQGMFTQGGMGQISVMAANHQSTTDTLLDDQLSESSKNSTSIQTRRSKAQRIASSLSNLGLEDTLPTRLTPSKAKNRIQSSHSSSILQHLSNLNYDLTSGSDSPLSLTRNAKHKINSNRLNKTKHKRSLHTKKSKHHSHRKSSSTTAHDCVVCRQTHKE